MAFLDLLADLRQARSDLADHNERVAEADQSGDWDTKDNLREADSAYGAALVNELDKIIDTLDQHLPWPLWRRYLGAALDHAQAMPDDADPVRLSQIVDDLDRAARRSQVGL
jgi:hypothetical protein